MITYLIWSLILSIRLKLLLMQIQVSDSDTDIETFSYKQKKYDKNAFIVEYRNRFLLSMSKKTREEHLFDMKKDLQQYKPEKIELIQATIAAYELSLKDE